MKTLKELADLHGTDKGVWFLDYPPLYDVLFTPIRSTQLKILEIGVDRGNSLKMWYDYFPKAHIFGYDILKSRRLKRYNRDRVTTFQGDQSSRENLNRFIQTHGGDFDIIIDDGSHISVHQLVSLGTLFHYVKPGGWYFIEDLGAELAQRCKKTMKDFMVFGKLQTSAMFPHEVVYLEKHVKSMRFLDKGSKTFAGEKLLMIEKI